LLMASLDRCADRQGLAVIRLKKANKLQPKIVPLRFYHHTSCT
jgi:hypothetical protein